MNNFLQKLSENIQGMLWHLIQAYVFTDDVYVLTATGENNLLTQKTILFFCLWILEKVKSKEK